MEWGTAIKGFQAHLKLEKGLSSNSIAAYVRDIEKLEQYAVIAGLKPDLITLGNLRQFITWVSELGMMPSSQARVLSGVKSFYKYLLLEDVIKNDPAELLESPKKQRKLPVTLSYNDIEKLIITSNNFNIKTNTFIPKLINDKKINEYINKNK